jgi:hypothetical protein
MANRIKALMENILLVLPDINSDMKYMFIITDVNCDGICFTSNFLWKLQRYRENKKIKKIINNSIENITR